MDITLSKAFASTDDRVYFEGMHQWPHQSRLGHRHVAFLECSHWETARDSHVFVESQFWWRTAAVPFQLV